VATIYLELGRLLSLEQLGQPLPRLPRLSERVWLGRLLDDESGLGSRVPRKSKSSSSSTIASRKIDILQEEGSIGALFLDVKIGIWGVKVEKHPLDVS